MRTETPIYEFTCDLCSKTKNSACDFLPDQWVYVKLTEEKDAPISKKYRHICGSCTNQIDKQI